MLGARPGVFVHPPRLLFAGRTWIAIRKPAGLLLSCGRRLTCRYRCRTGSSRRRRGACHRRRRMCDPRSPRSRCRCETRRCGGRGRSWPRMIDHRCRSSWIVRWGACRYRRGWTLVGMSYGCGHSPICLDRSIGLAIGRGWVLHRRLFLYLERRCVDRLTIDGR